MRYYTILLLVVSVIVHCGSSHAGNLNMIEQRLQELDALNKQVVQQNVDTASNGVVKMRAEVPPHGNMKKVELTKLSISKADSLAPRPYTLQIQSSPNKERILSVAEKMRGAGIPVFVSTPVLHEGKQWWRLFIGSYTDSQKADKFNEELAANKLPKGLVVKLPYAIRIGGEMEERHAEAISRDMREEGYMTYVVSGIKEGMVKVLLGAYKTDDKAVSAMKALPAYEISMFITKR